MSPSAPSPTVRRHRGVLGVVLATCLVGLPAGPAVAATPTVGGAGTVAATEQAAPVDVGAGLTVTGGSSFDGAAVAFEVAGATAHDQLALATDPSAATGAGVVSVVGTDVHLGDGASSTVIGSVDGLADGADGAALRVDFLDSASGFTNAGFEMGTAANWVVQPGQVDLGATAVAGCTTSDTSTYHMDASPKHDDAAPLAGSQTGGVTSAHGAAEGVYALELLLHGVQPATTSGVVHGPAVSSGTFSSAAGSTVSFQWRSIGGGAHDVLAYLLADGCGGQTEVLDSLGSDGSDTSWSTASATVPSTGDYQLVFVAGSFDADADGAAATTRVLLDDLAFVAPALVTDAVVQQVARRLTYAFTGDAPPASRSITVTATNDEANSGTDTITVDLAATDDLPSFPAPADLLVTNVEAAETRTDLTGTHVATDPDGDALTYGLVGAEAGSWELDGTTYTQRVVTTYGALHLVPASGSWRFVHDDAAIEAKVDADDAVAVDLTATDGTTTLTVTQDVVVDVHLSVASAPLDLRATPGDHVVALTWTAPTWLGAQPVTGYRVEVATDGVWSDVVADTGTTVTDLLVDGLHNGRQHTFRVRALNGSGQGPTSSTASATPYRPVAAPVQTVEATVEAGGRVTTDRDLVGPTADQPVTATVTTPVAGDVVLTLAPPTAADAVAGFAPRAHTLTVEAPAGSAAAPLVLGLRADVGVLPGTAPGRLLVLLDGVAVTEACTGSGATPDPCVASRTTADDGDLLLELRTSTAGRVVLAEPTHACPGQLAPSGGFADTAGDATDCVAWWRPGTGTGGGLFGATQGLSRGQVASLVADLLAAGGLALPDGDGAEAFLDLEPSAHRREVLQLVELGILAGYADGTFRPGRTLSRAELALVLVRVAELLEGEQLTGTASGLDDLGGGQLAEVVRRAVAAGLADARSDGSFGPSGRVRRDEGARYLVRLLDRLVADGALDLPVD